jgi:hypothetical protein
MRTGQIVIGFEMPVFPADLAAILEKYYGPVEVGKGLFENGLQTNCFVYPQSEKKSCLATSLKTGYTTLSQLIKLKKWKSLRKQLNAI